MMKHTIHLVAGVAAALGCAALGQSDTLMPTEGFDCIVASSPRGGHRRGSFKRNDRKDRAHSEKRANKRRQQGRQ